MDGQLRDKVASGVAWSMAEKVGTMLLQLAVSLTILRLLNPAIMGVIAIPTAFLAVAIVIADSGFSQALIRKGTPTADDYKSVFAFNVGVALVLYGVLVALAGSIARFYDMPEITRIAPVFFLQLPLSSACAIQNTIFVRTFRFALLSKVTFASWFIAGMVAIGLALAGFGIWCIVVQRVLQASVRALLLWWLSDWRPCGKCSRRPLREMAPYSFSLLATDFISTLYNKVPQIFLGKLYPQETLGSYEQAVKLKDQPATSAMQAVQNVTFPALAKIKDDAPKLAESYRQIVMVVAYAMFPVMLGLSAIAEDMFAVFLGGEWMATVPYFEAVCLAGLFYPLGLVAYNVLKVKSGGALIVKLEVAKKVMMSVVFAVTIPVSVQAVIWGLVVIAFCEMAINFFATTRFTSFGAGRFVRTVLPMLLVAGAMYALVRVTALAVPGNAFAGRSRRGRGQLRPAFCTVPARSLPRGGRTGQAPVYPQIGRLPGWQPGLVVATGYIGKTSAGSISGGRFFYGAVPVWQCVPCLPVRFFGARLCFAARLLFDARFRLRRGSPFCTAYAVSGTCCLGGRCRSGGSVACAAPLPVRRRPSGRWCRGGRPVRWRPAIRVRSRRGRPKRGR